jgi:hypothetical protein
MSFVIVEIMESKTPEEIHYNAICFIRKQETFIRYLINVSYYFFNLFFSFINFLKIIIYFKSFDIKNVTVEYLGDTRYLKRPLNSKFIVLDNGIEIYNFFIPYESILQYGSKDNVVALTIFGKIQFGLKKINIKQATTQFSLQFETNFAENVCNIIKRNMYYHIKYNKIDKKLIEKYYV